MDGITTEIGDTKLIPLVLMFREIRFSARQWRREDAMSGGVMYVSTEPGATVTVTLKGPDGKIERKYDGPPGVLEVGDVVHLPPASFVGSPAFKR